MKSSSERGGVLHRFQVKRVGWKGAHLETTVYVTHLADTPDHVEKLKDVRERVLLGIQSEVLQEQKAAEKQKQIRDSSPSPHKGSPQTRSVLS